MLKLLVRALWNASPFPPWTRYATLAYIHAYTAHASSSTTPNMALIPSQTLSSPCAFSFSSISFGVNQAHDVNIAFDDSFGSPAMMCDRRKKVWLLAFRLVGELIRTKTHNLLVRFERSNRLSSD